MRAKPRTKTKLESDEEKNDIRVAALESLVLGKSEARSHMSS